MLNDLYPLVQKLLISISIVCFSILQLSYYSLFDTSFILLYENKKILASSLFMSTSKICMYGSYDDTCNNWNEPYVRNASKNTIFENYPDMMINTNNATLSILFLLLIMSLLLIYVSISYNSKIEKLLYFLVILAGTVSFYVVDKINLFVKNQDFDAYLILLIQKYFTITIPNLKKISFLSLDINYAAYYCYVFGTFSLIILSLILIFKKIV